MQVPSGEKTALSTMFSCPRSVLISVPVVESQSRAVRSWEAVRMQVPSGEKTVRAVRRFPCLS
jgi:hypothetical protein